MKPCAPLFAVGLALLAPAAARADECRRVADAVIRRTLAREIGETPTFHNVRLAHDGASEFTVLCAERPQIFVASERIPDPLYLMLIGASAAAAFGGREAALAGIAADCLVAAATGDGHAERDSGGLHFDCGANSAARDYSVGVFRLGRGP